jgi:DNA-directed RNA polymerase specialized sigma24 family protein
MPEAGPHGSVTIWLDQLKAGDPAAAKPLWDGYFARLVGLARQRLKAGPRAAADEEDVALSAFDSFCRAAAGGRFPRLDDRDDLWHVLLVLTTRKAAGLVRHETREKRGGRKSAVDPAAAVEPSLPPDVSAELADSFSRLIEVLGDASLRQVALWKLEGDTNAEIAVKLGRAVPTVERKLAAIRAIWGRENLR